MTKEEFIQIAKNILASVYIKKAGEIPVFDWFISELYERIKGDLK